MRQFEGKYTVYQTLTNDIFEIIVRYCLFQTIHKKEPFRRSKQYSLPNTQKRRQQTAASIIIIKLGLTHFGS